MVRFDKDNAVLSFTKIEVPEMPTFALAEIRDSYKHYTDVVIYDDIKYLEGLLREIKSLESLELRVHDWSVSEHTSYRNGTKLVRDIPIIVDVYLNGNKVKSNWDIVHIPTMHDYGKFNVNGNLKSIVMQLRSSFDISYSGKEQTLNIAMPQANVRIVGTERRIFFKTLSKNIDVLHILITLLLEAGDTTPLTDYIRSTRLLQILKYNSGAIPENIRANTLEHNKGFLGLLKSERYTLGTCRDSINKALGLDRGIGYKLAVPVLDYPIGYIVDERFVADVYRARLNTYVVGRTDYPDGYLYANVYPRTITMIPAGCPNCAKLRNLIPQYADSSVIPYDTKLSAPLVFTHGTPITQFDFELFDILGMYKTMVATSKTSQPFEFSLLREITGNYMAPLYMLTDNIPADRSADEWVYYFDNPNLEPRDMSNLTAHDLLAMVSLLGEIILTGKSPLLDRDTAFLKRIAMCDEIMSESLRNVMNTFVSKNKGRIARAITAVTSDSNYGGNPFSGLSKLWTRYMLDQKYLASLDTTNLSAEISQACRVNTPIPNSKAINDEQRHLALPFYGRLCMFETPAGFKLGVVNSRAIGSRLRDGLLESPYRKVLRSGNGIRISNDIEYLTVHEELGCKFGDILSLKQDANGNYLNTKVLARIPNSDTSEDPFIFKNINAFDLAGGYVEAYPEQGLSPVACLMPFIGSNNPVRVSFGISQLKQAINLVDSEVPLVTTPMYQSMFEFATSTKYYADRAGVVTSIDDIAITIKADDDSTNYRVVTKDAETTQTHQRIIDYLDTEVGKRVSKGQLIAEGNLYPQDFVVRAPIAGYVRDITHSTLTIVKSERSDAFDLSANSVCTIPLDSFRRMGNNVVFLNLHVSEGDYVKKGQILGDTCTSREGVFSPSRNPLVMFMPYGYNYEDGVCATEQAAVAYTSFLSAKIEHRESNKLFQKVTVSRPHDFTYCDAGQSVTSVKRYLQSSSPVPDRVVNIPATHKAHGIYYRHEDNPDFGKRVHDYTFHVLSFNKLKVGDKMSGRHGNKGVISKVLPDSQAPQLANGMIADFILGPCGVPSRMNLGQMLEVHSSLIAKVLCLKRIESPSYNGMTIDECAMYMRYTHAVANNVPTDPSSRAPMFWALAKSYPEIPQSLHQHVFEHLDEIFEWRGVFNEMGCAEVYDPETDTWLENVVIGFPMYNKLVQEADEKMNARAGALEESYAAISHQPIDDLTSVKGQRMAEMELMALAALGASNFIREILNEKSDNAGARINTLLRQLGETNEERYLPVKQCTPHATEQLLFLLEACGVKLEVPEEIADTSHDNAASRVTMNFNRYLTKRFSPPEAQESTEATDDFSIIAGK